MNAGTFLVTAALVVVFVVSATMLNGYALSVLWGWFVVPTFETVPPLSLPAAIGIAMVVGFLTNHTAPKKREESYDDTIWDKLSPLMFVYAKPIVALLFGFIVQLFM